jgi:predicted nucleic acid-binding protein
MTPLLVDTDVASFDFKHDTRADLYRPIMDQYTLCLSFMSLAELEIWSIRANWGERKLADFQIFLHGFIALNSNREMSRGWADITAAVERKGHHIGCADAWTAACAVHYNLPLVTHNKKDFIHVPDLTLIS